MASGYSHNYLLSFVTLFLLAALFASSVESPSLLSPQGCRMSWMSPSYFLQTDFNTTWTRLSRRYSLWLYREEGWESHLELLGTPVLFIPGNAGSSRQVRSIASSATRQYYIEPSIPNQHFVSHRTKPLDFFTVDFNEDFSAVHSPTLLSERAYTSAAIQYILSRYPPGTRIILMGHSMGGIVALSLLPSSYISAIITMSTPHTLPPARLDKGIEDIYSDSWVALRNDSIPVLSVCGGATDLMIPSETCMMEEGSSATGWRKTIFTSCMEGTWTGVGHREMVWCHQVRWRIARAALELGAASNDADRGAILDRWFRGGLKNEIIGANVAISDDIPRTFVPSGHRLVLRNPPHPLNMYLLPLPSALESTRFVLYASRGAVGSVSPYHSSDLKVSVYQCPSSQRDCQPLQPRMIKLIPDPPWEMQFPVPEEGVDESDGVVFFEAPVDLTAITEGTEGWIGVTVQGGGRQGNWVVAGIEREHTVHSNVGRTDPFRDKISISVDPAALETKIRVPNLLLNSLLVYRVSLPTIAGSCSGVLLPPLLHHFSGPAEGHFHTMDGRRPLLVHSHAYGPFISPTTRHTHGLNFTIYSSGECGITRLELSIDLWSSVGRWALRYWTTISAWAVGVVGVMVFQAWNAWEKGGSPTPVLYLHDFPSVSVSLSRFTDVALVPLSGILLLASLLPFGPGFLLGNSGEPMFAPLAPLLLLIANGCVTISWYFLRVIMWFLLKMATFSGRTNNENRTWKLNIWSLGAILLLVATAIPSQVAFLACFVIHLFTCAVQTPAVGTAPAHIEAHRHKTHALLLFFWLLPLAAPVLAVWVRTLATAGLTTPFDSDHDVFAIASFLLFADFASSFSVPLVHRASSRLRRSLTMIILSCLVVVPFVYGGRYTYRVHSVSNLTVAYFAVLRITGAMRLWTLGAA